jgi:hypothetical protein
MPQAGLLLDLCRRDASPGALAAVLAEVRWQALGPSLRRLADDNQVFELVCSRLNQSRLLVNDWGFTDEEALGQFYRSRCRMAMAVDLELERVLDTFRTKSVDAVLLKGAALRRAVYDASVERQMADVDLLVSPDAFDVALEALDAGGYHLDRPEVRNAYRRHHYHFRAFHPAGLTIELHWNLSRPGEPIQLDADGVRSRARPLARRGRLPALVPGFEDLLLHAVEQASDGAFASLRHLVDFDRIVGVASADLDWTSIRSRAHQAGLTPALAHASRLARRMLGTEIPPGAVPDLSSVTRYHLDRLPAAPLLDARFRHATAQRLVRFWLLPGLRVRIAALLRGVTRPRDPMEWCWTEIAGDAVGQPGKVAPLIALLKSLLYHGGVSFGLVGGTSGPPKDRGGAGAARGRDPTATGG